MGFDWTDEQKQVINSRTGNLLVSAAAGSGKTAVLVERIIEMVMGVDSDGNKISDGMDIDELLVVTFTRAAAAQMKEKIAAALEKLADDSPMDEHIVKQLSLVGRADITTIDGFCLGIVKDYFNVVGIDSSFDIADNQEMELIKNDVFCEVIEEYYKEGSDSFLHLVDCFARKESDEKIKDYVYKKIYKVAASYPKPEKWIKEALAALDVSTKEELEQAKWYKDYEEKLKEIINSSITMARKCESICNEPDGPEKYLDNINPDIRLMEGIYNASGIDDIKAHIDKFGRLKPLSRNASEKEIIVNENIKAYRKRVKEITDNFPDSDKILAECKLMAEPLKALLLLTLSCMERLREVKQSKNLYEFRDISEFAYDILCEEEPETGRIKPSRIGLQISAKYREVFIDEYQDSNFLQEAILNCVSGHGENINNTFMVGDIKQSIYRFRMARPDLFLEKYNTYTEEVSSNRKILLSSNFRSSKNIVDTVNKIFKPLMTKNLGGIEYDASACLIHGRKEVSDAENKSEIIVVKNDCNTEELSISNDEAEAEFIADKIYQLVNGDAPLYIPDEGANTEGATRKLSYSDIVVLSRSMKKKGQIYEEVFAKRGIPLVLESDEGYFDAIEVSTLLSMLAVVDNAYSDYELAAVLRSPLAGLSEEKLARIVGIYNRDLRESEANTANASLYEKIIYYVSSPDYPEIEELNRFLEMLAYLKENKNYMSISDIIYYILSKTGYYWFAGAMPSGKRRQANIDMLISKAYSYEKSSFKGLFNFLRYMEKLRVNDQDFAESSALGESENAVSMTTMHKSKGIEYPVVFVVGTGSEFSKQDSREPIVVDADTYLSGFAVDLKQRAKKNTFARKSMLMSIKHNQLAEEIRILYVALTRAREKLYITASVKYDEEKPKDYFDFSGMFFEDGKISYNDKLHAKNYMEWIMMALEADGGCPDEVIKQEIFASEILAAPLNEQISNSVENNNTENDIRGFTDETARKTELYDKYSNLLGFSYKYKNASSVKNKMSVTEIKRLSMRGEDYLGEELYKTAETDKQIPVLKSRINKKPAKGADFGTVIHKIMELIDFGRPDLSDVKEQIDSYFERGIFPDTYKGSVRPEKIYNMINGPLGKRMAAADICGKLYREQQFYMGMKPSEISEKYAGNEDTVVVQGIIDAYFIEGDELVLLDYKTDRVKNIDELKDRYHVQLELYAKTLEKLTGMRVKEKLIYAFHFDDSLEL